MVIKVRSAERLRRLVNELARRGKVELVERDGKIVLTISAPASEVDRQRLKVV
jgi:hypothetical protein